eukprot:402844_1
MLARTKTCIVRTYQYSFRWISKEISSIKPTEIAKFIQSTDNMQDTLNLNWNEMTNLHKQYFQETLTQNKPIKNISDSTQNKQNNTNNQFIDHIKIKTVQLTNKDALNMFEWLNKIFSSPNNQIKHLNFDLSNPENEKTNVINSECIHKLTQGIVNNPNKTIPLESLEFHSISLNTQDIQNIFDFILSKCRYCEYLSLENCLIEPDKTCEIIHNFYYENDYGGLRNTSLNEIDLYNNRFEYKWLFHNHALVSLNRNIKKFLRWAVKYYGDFLMVENILIHTNDSYFRYCILPNLRMTIGTVSRLYTVYCTDIVRYNRRNWKEQTIKSMRKMALISWFAIWSGIAAGDIMRRGKQSWWFTFNELLGNNSIKVRKRESY